MRDVSGRMETGRRWGVAANESTKIADETESEAIGDDGEKMEETDSARTWARSWNYHRRP